MVTKKSSLIILAITSMVCSRAMFSLIDDPEGPNLLIVTVMGVILFSVSSLVYLFKSPATALKKLLVAICIQIVVVTGLLFYLKKTSTANPGISPAPKAVLS